MRLGVRGFVIGVLTLATLSCGSTEAGTAQATATSSPATSTPQTAAPSTPTPAAALPLAGRTIVLDPGHQLGNSRHPKQIRRLVDVGNGRKACNSTGTASNAGYPEATFTFGVATATAKRLRALGAKVVLTRDANSRKLWGPCVDVRGKAGKKAHADLTLSIHGDGSASRNHGFHVIVPKPLKGLTAKIAAPSKDLGKAVRDALLAASFVRSTYTGGADALNIRSDLGTLNRSKVPVAMVELGNMRNARDAKVMSSAQGQRRYARALAAGIESYLSARD